MASWQEVGSGRPASCIRAGPTLRWLAAQARAKHQLKPHDPSPSSSALLTSLRVCAQSSSSIRTPVSGSALGGLSCTASDRDTEGGLVSPVRLGPSLSGAPHFADLVILFHLPPVLLVAEYVMVGILRLSFHPCWGVSAVETRSTVLWAHLSSHRQREQRCPKSVLHPTSCSHLPSQPGGEGVLPFPRDVAQAQADRVCGQARALPSRCTES